MSHPSDLEARTAAIDPERSFIVQAPAGSGKTELLIQRYLALLARVKEPEQIVAITFTRKAAAEMRERVVRALNEARDERPPAEPHRLQTYELARQASAQDAREDWGLGMQPQRMRIETLDALNASLARRLPVVSGAVAASSVVDDAGSAYRLAARRTVDELAASSALSKAIVAILARNDGKQTTVETLIADLLARRDQWQSLVLELDSPQARLAIEHSIATIVEAQLTALIELFPKSVLEQLVPIMRHAARHAPSPKTLELLAPWIDLDQPCSASAGDLDAWRAIAATLLTQQGQWRKQVTRQNGLAAGDGPWREQCLALLEDLRGCDGLDDALAAAAALPAPVLGEQQWTALLDLSQVLSHAAAELRVVFSTSGIVDFTEIASAAAAALGSVDRPSDLLLALDRRIEHVLVDEFQDTSQAQLRLLELLTAGWMPGDGRSLFLVGDPMQSIYRFRNADMSIFIRTRERGLSSVNCEPLELSSNFRSAPAIVDWTNSVFSQAFPPEADANLGLAGFYASEASRTAADGQSVSMHALEGGDTDAETHRVLQLLESERARFPAASIGVLVQSRAHLLLLYDELRHRGLPVRAVEIEGLHQNQAVQDALGLTRALTHLADRIAWLGVLRAPWCGLRWSNLESLVSGDNRSTVWELMHAEERLQRLSKDGCARLLSLRDRLQSAFDRRATSELSDWVERTWLSLGGPDTLEDEVSHRKLLHFFTLLAAQTNNGDLDDIGDLTRALKRPQREADEAGTAQIDLMTIHRSKGLEFDCVIIFGLNRSTRTGTTPLMRWAELTDATGTDHLLLAASLAEDDALSDYLKGIETQRDSAEKARLLYVATTRARERLHLVWSGTRPDSRGLLRHMWPVAETVELQAPLASEDVPATVVFNPQLRRFAAMADAGELQQPANAFQSQPQPDYQWVRQSSVQVGTLVHAELQRIAESAQLSWNAQMIASRAAFYANELRLLGLEEDEIEVSTGRVLEALERILADPRGQWILRDWPEADSELELTAVRGGRLVQLRLDRTFVDEEGTRWIIDYKTSTHEGADIEAFLDTEVERYSPQLTVYAAALRAIDSRPIRAGLYFPLLEAFRAWEPDSTPLPR